MLNITSQIKNAVKSQRELQRQFRQHCCHNASILNSKCSVSELYSQILIPSPNLVEMQHLPKTYMFNLHNFLRAEFSTKPKISSLIQGQTEKGAVFWPLNTSAEHPQESWLLLASETDIRSSKGWKSSLHPAKSTITLGWCDRKEPNTCHFHPAEVLKQGLELYNAVK